MKPYFFVLPLLLLFAACRKRYEAPVPGLEWDLFNATGTAKLPSRTGAKMEGVYTVGAGTDVFGADAAAKWTYTAAGTDTTFHLSFFCQKDAVYALCEGRRQPDSTVLLNGYWRRMVGTETGRIRLTIGKAMGAKLLSNAALLPTDVIIIDGLYGNGEEVPGTAVQFRYARPLYKAKPLEIVAHRGGGRTSDLLPASENTVEIIRMASRFGATGIEIDVRLTRDGVPVLFHDGTLNERLIQKNGMIGPIENYTYAQLHSLVRLIKGERIPTLREALTTVVYGTPLRYVWLDTKFNGDMKVLHDFQTEFSQAAAAIGRNLTIHIGIPDRDVLANFKKLPGYQTIPSVNELTREETAEVNSAIWAPRFTLGLQNAEVAEVQAQGRKAFVWTLDAPDDIREYLYNGRFDGILTNYPSAVAYYYYAKQ